jgi:hypothetical protein
VFFVVAGAVGLWAVFFRLLPCRALVGLTSYLVPTALTGWIALQTFLAVPADEFRNCWKFALGRTGLADAYAYRQAVYPPAVAASRAAGGGARVYTFNLNNYCMAPGCEQESFVSFALHQDWHEVMFGPAPRARELLQRQGLNYFLIDLGKDIIDVIQFSPLFAPGEIADNFEVAWHEGDVYLLTWAGSGGTPLPDDFPCRYETVCESQSFNLAALYERVWLIYYQNQGKSYPVRRDPKLPPVKGWQ